MKMKKIILRTFSVHAQYAEANFKKSYGIRDKYYHSMKGYTLRDHNQQYLKSPLLDQILLSKSP